MNNHLICYAKGLLREIFNEILHQIKEEFVIINKYQHGERVKIILLSSDGYSYKFVINFYVYVG